MFTYLHGYYDQNEVCFWLWEECIHLWWHSNQSTVGDHRYNTHCFKSQLKEKKKCEMKNHNCMCAQSCLTLWDPMDCSTPGSSAYGNFPGKNTEEGCHFLLQEIFLAQGSNPCLLHWQADSLPQRHLGSPKTTMTVSIFHPPFSCYLKSKKKSFLSSKHSKNM